MHSAVAARLVAIRTLLLLLCLLTRTCLLQGQRHDDSESEDEWTDEEDDAEALDTADPFLYFADTLRAVQAQHPARFQVCASSRRSDVARAFILFHTDLKENTEYSR